jgi:Ser/Thr protein kinase RdoA (MazF antagonist)
MDTLTDAAAEEIARRHWGLHARASALPSHSDRNVLLCGEDGARFVLKFAHAAWSFDEIDLENQAMLALARRELALGCPRVHPARGGEFLLALSVAGQTRLVRLLDFVPGKTYAEAIGGLDPGRRAALHESLGHAVGRLTRGLAGFRHRAAAREHDWNLLRLPAALGEIERIEEASLRELVRRHAEGFCAALPSRRERFPIDVLHNDANDLNVIVDDEGATPYVRAIIDFGDTCTSFRLADLAIACAYALQHEDDPVACARRIVGGYVAEQALLRRELEALHDFILARLCQSILLATRAAREQPGNDFARVSQAGVRRLLRALSGIDGRALVEPLLESARD